MNKFAYMVDSYMGLQPGAYVEVLGENKVNVVVKVPNSNFYTIVNNKDIVLVDDNSPLYIKLLAIVEYGLDAEWDELDIGLFLQLCTTEQHPRDLKEALQMLMEVRG